MKSLKFVLILLGVLILISACGRATQTPAPPVSTRPEEAGGVSGQTDRDLALKGFKDGGCGACHIIPGVPGAAGTLGPDLSAIGQTAQETVLSSTYTGQAKTAADFLRESISKPDAYIAADCGGKACQKGLMPANLAETLGDAELDAIVSYMLALPAQENAASGVTATPQSTLQAGNAPELSQADFDWAKQTYFERCAGCHGTLRMGATGPALTPDVTQPMGTLALAAIIFNGTTGGMPDWGKQGLLTQEQTEIMAKFLQQEPPTPPEYSLAQMKETWKVLVPPAERPTQPQTQRDWQNYFIVTLRDAGQVAIIDGDTHEIVNTVNSGYAVHITRMSATGRYAYVIGRDGKLALIDLWMEKPDVVAQVQVCYDARSVEVSKYNGEKGNFEDKYAIVGCYWPPHFVFLDGQTLEPFKIVSTRSYTYDTEEYHPEPRVASILASHFKPEWIVNIKETGLVWIVDYSDPNNPTIKMIEAERFLHDGGLDSTKRYFLVAANQSNKIAVIDLLEEKLVAKVETDAIPHPGRGANWIDPEFGPVWSTSHLGDGAIVSIGTDPENHPDHVWKVVRTTPLPGDGSLFIKTHPDSKWIWVDMTLNTDPVLARTICVVAKAQPDAVHKCWQVADYGRAVHFEYNKQGTQVWVSVWGDASKPGQTGEIVIYDDATLKEVARIPNLVTPTGKFNVYNTVYDIY
ncbi:dissimilatory nitrite reductase (NO-forming), cytochrome cd1 type apoprotein [Longilinea arvoryzae]|uniref:Dissimilatory nitrite reductase (NO-forming), cytochrome cd1 type apoprotein n=1 Tax=Longilinea arvoryzae TaxID=360412 RepID=A0A0S7BCR9_9CHLR|nr:cytochrome D1 domain-containing protein [Longilinea arvoryzae]GAP13033.1 dissimilatory nitrite reductase (NO-forming), cytochrome cd1 type apoprotein [Longilinea arvoryzae]